MWQVGKFSMKSEFSLRASLPAIDSNNGYTDGINKHSSQITGGSYVLTVS